MNPGLVGPQAPLPGHFPGLLGRLQSVCATGEGRSGGPQARFPAVAAEAMTGARTSSGREGGRPSSVHWDQFSVRRWGTGWRWTLHPGWGRHGGGFVLGKARVQGLS